MHSRGAPRLVSCLLACVALAVLVAPVQPVASMCTGTAAAQTGDPTWRRLVTLRDGRTFVTDGALAIDAAIAKPATLPTDVVADASARLIEGYLSGSLRDEFRLTDLIAGTRPRTYAAPSGITLGATYVEFLRRVLPGAGVRLRMGGDTDPVVLVVNGTAVGLLMPVKR